MIFLVDYRDMLVNVRVMAEKERWIHGFRVSFEVYAGGFYSDGCLGRCNLCG